MEFSFPFKLTDGAELIVDAEVTEKDTIIRGISCPDGALSAERTGDAAVAWGKIEASAVEEYRERLGRIIADRKDGAA